MTDIQPHFKSTTTNALTTSPERRRIDAPKQQDLSTAHRASGDGGEWLPVSLGSFLEVPFRYRSTIVKTVLVAMLVGWLAILAWPRRYESEAKLKIRVGRASVALDPTVTTSQTMLMQKTREEEVVTTLEVLGSRQVAMKVVDKLGAASVLDDTLPGSSPAEAKKEGLFSRAKNSVMGVVHLGLHTIGLKDDISDHELAVLKISDQLSVYAPKKSSVITINSESKNPEMAQLMAKTMIDVFMEEHLRSSATPGSLGFFENEVESVEKQLNQLVQDRTDFLQSENLVSMDASRTMLRDKMVALNRDILIANGKLEQARAKIKNLKGKIAVMDDEMVVSRQQASSPAWSGIRQRVYELEVAERNMNAIYTASHPQLISAREQLKGARDILDAIKAQEVNESTAINPAKTKAREELRQQETTVAGLESEIAKKNEQRKAADADVNQLVENERKLIQIDRDINVLESSLSLLNEKLEESRLIHELELKQFSNVSIVQPASLIQRPFSPNKKVLASAFVMFGGLFGVMLSFMKEFSLDTVRSKDHLAAWVNPAAIVEIPRQTGKTIEASDSEVRAECRVMLLDVLRQTATSEHGDNGRLIGLLGCHPKSGSSSVAKALESIADTDLFQSVKLVDWSTAPSVLKSDGDWDKQLAELSSEHDLVIIDLPSVQSLHQTQVLEKMDRVIVVVESEVTSESVAGRAIQMLSHSSNPNLGGVVLNKTRSYLPKPLERLLRRRSLAS